MNKFLIALLLIPLVSAQTEILSDSAGDVTKQIVGTDANLPIHDNLDLRSLTVTEGPNAFTFGITVESLEITLTALESAEYFVHLEHNGMQYRARIIGQAPLQGGEMQFLGNLQVFDIASERWNSIQFIQPTISGTMISFDLPRDWLFDGSGAAPFPGRALENIFVISGGNLNGFNVNGPALYFADAMPDAMPYANWDVKFGLQQVGSLRLESHEPVRASNGEATTFVFQTLLRNLEAQAQSVKLSTTELPSEWVVELPADELLLPPNSTIHVTAVVTVPFRHSHGAFESFVLEAASEDGASVGRLEIGVRYTEVPQPAGHHNKIFLHTAERATNIFSETQDTLLSTTTNIFGTMNTEEFYDLDTGEEYAAYGNGIGTQGVFWWDYFLSPSLQMGLDFDVASQGELSVRIESSMALTDATLEGTLFAARCTGNNNCPRTILGEFTSEPVDIPSSGATINAIFTPTEEADYLEYTPGGASLGLNLALQVPSATQSLVQPPRILPGAYMILPLEEYHDPVAEKFISLSALDFYASSAVERMVNPGETALFNFTLENTGLVHETYLLEVTGANDWGRLLGATEVQVDANDERRVVVAVTVAEGAADATVADFVVKATSTRDVSLQGLVPFRAVVDTVFDQNDESNLILETESELEEKSLPGFGIPLLILALLLTRRSKLQ